MSFLARLSTALSLGLTLAGGKANRGGERRSGQGGTVLGIRLVLCAALVGMLASLAPPGRPAEARHITYAATLHPVQQVQGGRSVLHPNSGLLGCLLPLPPDDDDAPQPALVGFL